MNNSIDYYSILGLDSSASRNQIKQAYRRLAKKYHPDLNPDNSETLQQFRNVNEAYEVLYDSRKRLRYDSDLKTIYISRQQTNNYKTHSSYDYSYFKAATQSANLEHLTALEKVKRYIKFALETLPKLHFILLIILGIFLISIPIEATQRPSQFVDFTTRLAFFIFHSFFATKLVEKSHQHLAYSSVLMSLIILPLHVLAAIPALICGQGAQIFCYVIFLPFI